MEVSLDLHRTPATSNGNELRQNCRAKWVIPALPRVTTVCSLRRCYGLRERAHPGVIYRGNSATGSPSTPGSGDGHKRALGSEFSSVCRMIPILNMYSSMRRTSGSISTEPAQKGDLKTGHRQIARLEDDEDCGGRRCARQSDPLRAAAGQSPRHHELRCSFGRHLLSGPYRRQGVRRPLVAQALGRGSDRAGHSSSRGHQRACRA